MYIAGIGCVSPQRTFEENYFFQNYELPNADVLKCVEPAYSDYINPMFSRRLSRIIKFSMAAAIMALNDAGIKSPGAIISGTGLGCIEDTEKFLESVIADENCMLSPTPFIQSTHNTVNSQLALYLKCKEYNVTYAHRIFSFHNALQDAMLLFAENSVENILVGGFDEDTENSRKIKNMYFGKRTGNIKGHKIPDGEGAAFFLLKNCCDENCYAKITAAETFRITMEKDCNISDIITDMLNKNGLASNDIDVVITGMNGSCSDDQLYLKVKDEIFSGCSFLFCKHLSGDYFTSSAFAAWVAAKIIKTQHVPEVLKLKDHVFQKINRILILDIFRKKDISVIILEKC